MTSPFLELKKVTVQLNGKKILDNLDLIMQPGELWAITGPSGSGKTILAHTIGGRYYYSGRIIFNGQTDIRTHIEIIEQQHRFKNLYNTSEFYYQQRYNASDAANTLTVADVLYPDGLASDGHAPGSIKDIVPKLLHLEHVMTEPLIQLSNGENKRLQIAKAILSEPLLLILDNPFTGLDAAGRKLLAGIIHTLSNGGINIILITHAKEIPDCITHVAMLESGKLISATLRKDFTPGINASANSFGMDKALLKAVGDPVDKEFDYAVRMVNVQVRYREKSILKNINWEVRKEERWSIAGPNGAGKSTLLSLITRDNAKAYANEIYLFDQRRGRGESIWDIKRKIGYVSPEMHVYFDHTATCFETIASGYFDTIGLFRSITEEQRRQVNQWISLFRLEAAQNTQLSLLSIGEQRLVLLARALVKNPPLLILDEPCQGLDSGQIHQFRQIINDVCRIFGTTLIYVSHYHDEIPDCVTHFMTMENGEVFIS